jgi:hypothetical protein
MRQQRLPGCLVVGLHQRRHVDAELVGDGAGLLELQRPEDLFDLQDRRLLER